MTIYNLIAVAGCPLSSAVLFDRCVMVQLPGLSQDDFDAGLQATVKRKRVVQETSATDVMYDIADKKRRIVSQRDRSDAAKVDDDGVMLGGWNGWMLRDARGALSALEATP